MKLLAREVVSATPAGSDHLHPQTLARALAAESTDTLVLIAGAPAGGVPAAVREAAAAVVAARADGQPAAETALPADDVPAETVAEILRSVLASVVPAAGARVDLGGASQLAARLTDLQHDHHELTVSATHAHLDHDHCIETVILRGRTDAVRAFAETVIAQPGVSHGQLHLVPMALHHAHGHAHLEPATAHPGQPKRRRAARPQR